MVLVPLSRRGFSVSGPMLRPRNRTTPRATALGSRSF
uniref:Uncharacterized protein n=1 Tax=Anguilla anguilla TaxID=7936 RepID=A0A0E9UDT8_ANGAN